MTIQLFDDMAQCSDQAVQEMLPLVTPQRRERALRFKFTFGQYACLKSFVMLGQILVNEGLIPSCGTFSDLTFTIAEHGKPSLTKYPDIHFSISHCQNAIAVAVDSKPIGIDVECYHLPTAALLRRTMNPEEIAIIEHAERPEAAFTRLWTRKEAVLKLRGTGIVDEIPNALSGTEIIQTTEFTEKAYICSVASTHEE